VYEHQLVRHILLLLIILDSEVPNGEPEMIE
jgi:hypothetical protein